MTHSAINIRRATPADFAQVLALNEDSVRFLSPMNAERLALLHGQAAYHSVVETNGQVGAFLMAHRNGSAYDSENFAWFARRYDDFFYIDRIAVSAALQGQGVGRMLYEHLFAFSRSDIGFPKKVRKSRSNHCRQSEKQNQIEIKKISSK